MARKLNIWKFFSAKMQKLDRSLTHDKINATYSPTADKKSPVIFPKLFRRLWEFEIKNKQTFTTGGYHEFLMGKKDDRCCKTTEFLKSGYPKKSPLLGSFLTADGKINFMPADIVFKEASTTLKNSKGKPVTAF